MKSRFLKKFLKSGASTLQPTRAFCAACNGFWEFSNTIVNIGYLGYSPAFKSAQFVNKQVLLF